MMGTFNSCNYAPRLELLCKVSPRVMPETRGGRSQRQDRLLQQLKVESHM